VRILIINNIFPPGFIGGYELGALDMARGLLGRRYEVEVLTSDYFVDDARQLDDVPVRRILDCCVPNRSQADLVARLQTGSFIVPRNLRLLASEIAHFRPDRILCFNLAGLGPLGILKYLVAAGYRPVLFLMDNIFAGTFAGTELDAASKARFEQVFGPSDYLAEVQFVFLSRNLRREVEDTLGRAVQRAAYVPCWVDAFSLPAVAERHSAPMRFVFSSHIAEHKGINLALNAARLVLDQGKRAFSLDVFGGGDLADMLQRVTAYGLQAHVYYHGAPAKQEMLRRFADFDALLFPTWEREPFGFVVCEAAAAGCIPVMTKGIGAGEWYLDGLDCLKIDRTPQALAAAGLRGAWRRQ
jgi:glycogen(starch) synthase